MANSNSAASQVAAPADHDPADCYYCGERAVGLGVGFTTSRDKDPKWICIPCSMLLDDYKRVNDLDAYRKKAREGGVEAAAPVIAAYGSHLEEYTDEQAAELAGVIWAGCAGRMRELIRNGDAPF